ncbi:MAG: DUF2993 domain-containing protein [Veillonellaceae bacterium]|nr:DUF2993 domain-containing protein [Veillonellaceae bacterium]
MKKVFAALLVIVLVIFGLGWLYLPSVVEAGLDQYLADNIPMQNRKVRLGWQNPFTLLGGKVVDVEASGEQAELDKLVYDSLHIHLQNVEFEPQELFQNHHFVIRKIGGGSISATLTQEELQRYLVEEVDETRDVENLSVRLANQRLIVSGHVQIGKLLSGDVEVVGEPLLNDNVLLIQPREVKLNKMGISGLGNHLVGPIVIYDFRKFPIPVTANQVVAADGKVTATAVPHKE